MSKAVEAPVLIVGGGGCGLALSIFLADIGVNFLTVERNVTTTDHPRAHILNQRTMEIFRQHGVADRIYSQGAPTELMERIVFLTSLGGDGPLDRKKIGSLDGYGGGELRKRYEADSACRATNLPLMQLEPLLRDIAEERAPGRVRFHHELVSFEQDVNGVTSRIRDHDAGEQYTVRSQFLIAADGGKTIGRLLGAEMVGPRRIRKMVNTYFSADLAEWIDDDGALLIYFINPDGYGQWAGGGLVKTGPKRWDRHSESWVFMRELRPDDPDSIDETNVIDRIRALLKLPNLEITVHKIGRWDVEGVVAKNYRFGRIFLAGDAAHRHPPVSALGLNTAFGDAHNIAWKLGLVIGRKAPETLLHSYETERQPVGARVAEWALNGFRMRSLIDTAIGLAPGQNEANRLAFERLFSETPGGATARAILAEAMHIQRIGPQAHDMEIGYLYEAGALVSDGTPPSPRDPMAGIYYSSTRPGSRLPHAWLDGPDGRVDTHQLVLPGRFAFLCDRENWRPAVSQATKAYGIPIDLVVIDDEAGYRDTTGDWRQRRQIGLGGAILARPDGHVAWRSMTYPDEPIATLEGAVRTVLGDRPGRLN